jgi:recombinational DNA repair protein (RecF pathway)
MNEELKIVRCAQCGQPINLRSFADEIHYSRYLGKWFCDRECAA